MRFSRLNPRRETFERNACARALHAFLGEHGSPNTIAPGELCAAYAGRDLTPARVGWLLRWRRHELEATCLTQGVRLTSYRRRRYDHQSLMLIGCEFAETSDA